jgi:hypothetical protein
VVDESATGSVNFFWSRSGYGGRRLQAVDPRTAPRQAGRTLDFATVHLRPPAFSHGFTSFLWAVGLGLFVWIGLVAVDVAGGTAFLFGLLSALGIFFFVRLYGSDDYRRR